MNKKIKFLIIDVDGTLTDGKIYMSTNGELFKVFDIKDGCGIKEILPKANITPIILTARNSIIVQNRCNELGIRHCYQGVKDKVKFLEQLFSLFSEEEKINKGYDEWAYIGDDIVDLPCMQFIKKEGGLIGCPQDAAKQVKLIADFICKKRGGDGAVREYIEWILEHNMR